MRVCDCCKSERCFPVKLIVVKSEFVKGKERNRAIISPEIDLCESCITKFNKSLWGFIKEFRRIENNEPTIAET